MKHRLSDLTAPKRSLFLGSDPIMQLETLPEIIKTIEDNNALRGFQ